MGSGYHTTQSAEKDEILIFFFFTKRIYVQKILFSFCMYEWFGYLCKQI